MSDWVDELRLTTQSLKFPIGMAENVGLRSAIGLDHARPP